VQVGSSFLCVISYPVVYFILAIPISAVRWKSGFGSAAKSLPSAAPLATECLFSLSGLVNVFIFVFTRSDLFMASNTETKGHRLTISALPSVNLSKYNDVELVAPQPRHQLSLPSTHASDGGWTLQSAQYASKLHETI
jgi:hypothetical protein